MSQIACHTFLCSYHWLLWVNVIIVPLIRVVLRFTLRSIHLNLPLNMFHIWTLLQSYQLMMMKWNNSCNSSIQIIVMIFCILTSICFSLYKWLLLIQNSIHSLMCCFINIEEKNLMSQIACHTFLCSYQTSPM